MTTAARVGAPVVPWFTGTRSLSGVRVTMGRDHVVAELARMAPGADIGVDLEGEGLVPPASDRLHCVGVGTVDHVVVVDPRDPVQADALRAALDACRTIVMHTSAFDSPVLHRCGLMEIRHAAKVVDIVIYARMVLPSQTTSKRLEDLSVKFLGRTKTGALAAAIRAEKITKSKMFERYDIDRPLYVEGNVADVSDMMRLWPIVRELAWKQLTEGHPYTEYGVTGEEAVRMLEREQVVNRGRLRRSMRGFRVDFDFADRFADQYDGHLAQAAQVLERHDVKPGDSASLVRWADKHELIPGPEDHPRLKNGQPSGAKKLMERIGHPLVKLFLLHKEQTKTQHDYLSKMRELSVNCRIHPTVAVFGAAASGRMSMGSPPVHQFPAGARGMILAEDGEPWTSIDWSQIEPVIAANLAQDMAVLGSYEAGTGDPYMAIAQLAGITRKEGKVVILADMYGQGLKLMAANLGIPWWDLDRAKGIKAAARSGYAKTSAHFDQVKAAARQYGLVPTVSGRMLPVPRYQNEETGRWEVADYMGVNYHVQGSAYDLLAEVLYQTELRGLGGHVHLTMHDELVVSTCVADEIEHLMRTPPAALIARSGRTPVLRTDRADLGERWAYV